MSAVTLTAGVKSITGVASVERTWQAAMTGQAGSARIRIPLSSPLASTNYLKPRGGSQVRIHGEGGCGDWLGIVLDLEYGGDVIEATAYQVQHILGRRTIQRPGTLRNLTAGFCATIVLRETLSGIRGIFLSYAPHEGGGPEVPTLALDGGDAWGKLSELMDLTDGELHITEGGRVTWCGPLAYGRLYGTLLVAGSSLRDWSYSSSGADRAAEVLATSGNLRYLERDGDAAVDGWPAQISLGSDAARRMKAEARAELSKRLEAAVTISGAVTSTHWSIRERDYIRVLIPQAFAGAGQGATHTCRVLGRSLSDDSPLMGLELQVIPPVVGTRSAGGGRVRPRKRPGRDGRGGSFAQQFQSLRRRMAVLERGS